MSANAPSLALESSERGTILPVRVQPKASADRIVGLHGKALKITVTAPPEKGKANEAVIKILAKALGVAPSTLELISGHTGRDKRVLIPAGVARESILALVANGA